MIATTTNDAGVFSVLTPSEEFVWLVVSASLHSHYAIGVWPGEPLPEITLMGGDMDDDRCAGTLDVALLTAQFDQGETLSADINADGLTMGVTINGLSSQFKNSWNKCNVGPSCQCL